MTIKSSLFREPTSEQSTSSVSASYLILNILDKLGRNKVCHDVWENGSQIHFITEIFIKLLQFSRYGESLSIKGIGYAVA